MSKPATKPAAKKATGPSYEVRIHDAISDAPCRLPAKAIRSVDRRRANGHMRPGTREPGLIFACDSTASTSIILHAKSHRDCMPARPSRRPFVRSERDMVRAGIGARGWFMARLG